jgi:hypothetical protein
MNTLFTDYAILAVGIMVFGIGGAVKGIFGIGLPIVVVTLLGLVMEPIEVIALLPIAIVATNIRQFFFGSVDPSTVSRRYAIFALALTIPMFLSAFWILHVPTHLIQLLMGVSVCLFAMTSLFGLRPKIGSGWFWQMVMGLISGAIGGLTSIWGPTMTMYLMARNIDKDEFIVAIGFLFLAGSFPLIVGLTLSGVITADVLFLSGICTVAALMFMWIGEKIRGRLSDERFRRLVLIFFLLMGIRLVVIGLWFS